MKLMQFLGLILFMVVLDYSATAQKCDPSECKKAIVTVQGQSENAAEVVSTATTTASSLGAKSICDPSDCPPICRIVCDPNCCVKSTALTETQVPSPREKVHIEPIELLADRKVAPLPLSQAGAD